MNKYEVRWLNNYSDIDEDMVEAAYYQIGIGGNLHFYVFGEDNDIAIATYAKGMWVSVVKVSAADK